MMLTNITAEKWEALLPGLFSCQQLQTLSLDNPEGLDGAAAKILMEKLPALEHLTVIRPELEGAQEMVSFISALKPSQLRSFSYSFYEFQVPVLRAIAGLTGLQGLGLTFNEYPPVDLHVLAPLTNLTSLTLIQNDYTHDEPVAQFEEWARERRETVAAWLISCQNLASLYVSSMPALVPAIADALPHLRLEKLHIYDSKRSMDLWRALRSQRLRYLFIKECGMTRRYHQCLADCRKPVFRVRRERIQAVMDAVLAMPCLRDLRLHTCFNLTTEHLRGMVRCVPRLETLSCMVACEKGEQAEPLEILEEFKHLTSLTCLGWTTFSARYILEWIQRTRCHLRPGGFSLCLPSQSKGAWYRHLSPGQGLFHCRYTGQIKELLKCFKLFVTIRGEYEQTWDWSWVTSSFHDHEQRMFFRLWRDVRGPADSLKMISGAYIIYPPYFMASRPLQIEVS
ncbi:hypothetical protein CPLU01_06456 [Colletotrichum plurivorum]|uniref:F-box domain-containing protein n=1 Tax=Colletotrichum plurivorum TaxID=2175906 RepID=A0A8H6KI18_9PEZI|nr:hypothetical protein CPLU01_06456 [Colletotrichum plurivorum]